MKNNEKAPASAVGDKTYTITYNVDKMTFVVTPVYRDDSGKTVHDLILKLMIKDGKNH